jgi:chromosome segregation ATPase
MSEVLNKYLDLEGLKKYDALIKDFIAKGNTDLADAIAALDAKLGSLDVEGSDDKSIAESIVDIYASIADIIAVQESLDAKDKELAVQIKKVADDLDFITGSSSDNEATLGEINATLTAVQEELAVAKESLNAAVAVADEAKAAATAAVADAQTATAAATQAQTDASDAKSAAEGAVAVADEAKAAAEGAVADAAQAKSDAAAAKVAVDVLVGDGDGSVKKTVETAAAEVIAQIVASAESDFDTLKEVADWIKNDKTGAAAIQTNVAKNMEDITKLDAKVDADIKNLSNHITDAAAALEEVDGRLDALENASIDIKDIANLFGISEDSDLEE